MLRYTGHPIADVGVATICAFSEKPDPASLTREDLENVTHFIEREYFSGKLASYLTCVFPNSEYKGCNPTTGREKVELFKNELRKTFERPPDSAPLDLKCALSGDSAAQVVDRKRVPMITGEDVLNFFPAGLGGMPISSEFLLAIQAFPLGARRCLGRALAVHCPDDQTLTYEFAVRFLNDNRKLMLLAGKTGEKYDDAKAPKTLVINVLLETARSHQYRADDNPERPPPSITVYHLTNSGQGPDIDVFQLPSQTISFILAAANATTGNDWRAIQNAAWERPAAKGKNKRTDDSAAVASPNPEKSRNFLFDDLFELPQNAARFVRTYFLRRAYRFGRKDVDPRRDYSLARDLDLVSWRLTALFCKEILGMDKNRIEAIRSLGDRIAAHVAADNDRRLFRGLYMAGRYGDFRNHLIKASAAIVAKGGEPLVSLDGFVSAFVEADGVERPDWTLARDLVLIRLIEELHRQKWFSKESELLAEVTRNETESEEDAAARP
jgi:CRISPR-associated protein Cst1